MLIAAIADGGRGRAGILDHLGNQAVDLLGGLSHEDMRGNIVEDPRGEIAGRMHSGEIAGVMDPDTVSRQTAPSFVIHKVLHRASALFSPACKKLPEGVSSHPVLNGDPGPECDTLR